ncbi:MAG: DEAD/DEAH box helicase, partial [Candidatus Methanoperedens sp.]|nr:DEAD/DEAH box helicase [Candidatus Methanoperedens sp.]
FTSQYDALFEKKILDKEKNSLISIPTGAGKTFLAEILIIKRLLKLRYETKNKNSIIVYLVPSRALAREKFDDFTKAFDGQNKLKFKACQITGEIVLDAGEAVEKNDIIIMTQEKFDMILREEFFGVGIDTLIVDEFHNIRSGYRGLKLQFAIIRFKGLPTFKESKIFLISAIVKKENFDEIGDWIYAENLFQTEWRPTFTRIGYISLDDKERMIHFNDGIAMDPKMPDEILTTYTEKAAIWLASKFAEGDPALLFSAYVTVPYTNKNHLLELARQIDQSGVKISIDKIANEKYLTKLKRIIGDEEIYRYFKQGIGVHWGQLPHPVRKIMEDAVREKAISILISTTTLAEGVNLPIKTIIIPSLVIQDESMDFGLFFNLIGRAGRPFKHAEGQIILIASDKGHRNPLKKVKKYYSATRNDIESIKSPIHLIFKLRDEIIPNYEKLCSTKSNKRNLNRLAGWKKELKVHEANLEAVMLAMVAEKLVPRISNNKELIKKITIGKSEKDETEKISTLLGDVEKRLIEDYGVIYFNENEKRFAVSDFGLAVYRTGFSPKTCLEIYNQLTEIAPKILKLKFYPKNLQFQKTNRDYFILLAGLMRDIDEAHSYFKEGFQQNFEDILLRWMEGKKIDWLANQFFKGNSSPRTHTMITMEGMLSGFSAWFLYAVGLLLNHIYKEMKIEDPSCMKSISRLPKYVWYGTTNRRALEIMRLDTSRELLRDDILLMVDAFEDIYIESILYNPDEVKSPRFRKRLSDAEGLKMEGDEFIRILYKIITKD